LSSIRPIGDEDIEAVVSLWRRCGLTRPWNDPYKDISFARASTNSTILVMQQGEEIIATTMVGHDGHRGMLYYVGVAPEFRGRGLGKSIVRAAEAWLAERGIWKVNLLLRAENHEVRGFYEALGYEVNPVLCMARRLAQE
jgi:ribosomal protein S18 acetylase RimI-like enzyme